MSDETRARPDAAVVAALDVATRAMLASDRHDQQAAAAAVAAFLRAMDAWRPGVAIQPSKWADLVERAARGGEG